MQSLDDTLVQDYDHQVIVYGASQGMQTKGEVITLEQYLGSKTTDRYSDQYERELGEEPVRKEDFYTFGGKRDPVDAKEGGSTFKLDDRFINTLASRIKPSRKTGAGFRFQ